jgi:hypothetical protein
MPSAPCCGAAKSCVSRRMLSARARISSAWPSTARPAELLAAPLEQLHAQFLFEQANLFADARLRGEQARGGGRHAQVAPHDLGQVTQLLQLHGRGLGRAAPAAGACPRWVPVAQPRPAPTAIYSTVTDLARLRGWSTSVPRISAT